MPGSSMSTCHMCHMHSHNPDGHNSDGLVRTNPLRTSRSKTRHHKSSHSKHHHHNHNRGYSSEVDDLHGGVRRTHSSSSSNLARLSENSHSYGRRSNSFSNYPNEVSIMPGGSSNPYNREMRHGSSHSLDGSIPGPSAIDPRQSNLPRVSPIIQPQIVPQPDILVNTMPRSRSVSRSGTLTRSQPNSLTVDNPHDYYLQLHRQKFKEEKRKHTFNLQTVMLIGCYTLLVMVAIVVGVVVCYQNGWLGLGPPQKRIGDKTVSNSLDRTSDDIRNHRTKFESDLTKSNNLKTRHLDPGESGGRNNNFGVELPLNRPSNDVGRNVNAAGIFSLTARDALGTGKDINSRIHQTNEHRQSNVRSGDIRLSQDASSLSTTNINPNLTHRRAQTQIPVRRENVPEPHSRFPSSPQSPRHQQRNSPKIVDGIIQLESISNLSIRKPKQVHATNIINSRPAFQVPGTSKINFRDSIQNHNERRRPNNPFVHRPVQPVNNAPTSNSPVLRMRQPKESFTTHQLLDLLALRHLRDLLNSNPSNSKSVLELLSNDEPSRTTRLKSIEKVTLNQPKIVGNPAKVVGITRPSSGRSLNVNNNADTRNLPSRNQVKIPLLKPKIVSNIPNANPTPGSTSINNAANNSLQGAIIQFLKNRQKLNKNSATDPTTNPIPNKQPTLIPSAVREPTSLTDLQFLRNLLARNPALQKTAASESSVIHTPRRLPSNPLGQVFGPRQGLSLSLPNGTRVNDNSPNSFNTENSPWKTPNKNITKISSRGRAVQMPMPRKVTSFDSTGANTALRSRIIGPDPSFSVLVQTDGLIIPKSLLHSRISQPVTTSISLNDQLLSSLRSQKAAGISFLGSIDAKPAISQVPSRELVIVKPGANNGINPDIIRSWTHMDSSGILSRGRVHSDGSFTFTNCRPIEACDKTEAQSVSNNAAGRTSV